jgi:hypothetical protein
MFEVVPGKDSLTRNVSLMKKTYVENDSLLDLIYQGHLQNCIFKGVLFPKKCCFSKNLRTLVFLWGVGLGCFSIQ